jgi:hypothetical protein
MPIQTQTHSHTNKQINNPLSSSLTLKDYLHACAPHSHTTCSPKTHTPYTYDLNPKTFTHHTHIHTQNHPHHINMLYTYTYKCNYSPITPSPLLYHNKLMFPTVSQLHLGLIFGSKSGPYSQHFNFFVTYEWT